jgi:LmbE family N-acetylglucosaminyl deacetylase
MCVGAHPDDESGAFGGALLLAHAKGIETQVLCLTDGQAASNRGNAKSAEDLEQLRREELAAANAILGVTRSEQLNFPDGQLDRQDFYQMVSAIVKRIREWRPQVILTFGPEGGANLHRDHTMVSLAATAAFHWAGRAHLFPDMVPEPYLPQKLYYCSPPFLFANGANGIPQTPYSLTLELGEMMSRKVEAFRAHRSQVPILERIGDNLEKRFGTEQYLLVAAQTKSPFPISEDSVFFSGVQED